MLDAAPNLDRGVCFQAIFFSFYFFPTFLELCYKLMADFLSQEVSQSGIVQTLLREYEFVENERFRFEMRLPLQLYHKTKFGSKFQVFKKNPSIF